MGVAHVDLRQVFVTGLETQLQTTLATLFDHECTFDHTSTMLSFWHGAPAPSIAFVPGGRGAAPSAAGAQELQAVLRRVRRRVRGLHNALLLAQDVVEVHGTSMWDRALAAVMRYVVWAAAHTVLCCAPTTQQAAGGKGNRAV